VALNLHSFYSGLERIFELIVRHVDGVEFEKGKTWHRDLLRMVSNDAEGVRPAVIGGNSLSVLDELRRFRHLVRNVYTVNLSIEKISSLMSALPSLWQKVRNELLAFANFLDDMMKQR